MIFFSHIFCLAKSRKLLLHKAHSRSIKLKEYNPHKVRIVKDYRELTLLLFSDSTQIMYTGVNYGKH